VKPAALLLHGHYLGGWAWAGVEQGLMGEGWLVAAPTLPGCGRGEEGLSARVGLSEHVDCALNALHALERRAGEGRVAVVAHSYSGFILQALLGRPDVASRLSAALFLDAALGQPGECLLDMLERAMPGVSAALDSQKVTRPPRGFVKPPELSPPTEPEETCKRYAAQCGPAPWGTFTDPLPEAAVSISQASAIPRAYARCENFPLTEGVWRALRDRDGWQEEVWPVGHLPMLSHPARVVAWVLQTVGQRRSAYRAPTSGSSK
jgi:pimeloyl-ACP methyl ester carboxylesterase